MKAGDYGYFPNISSNIWIGVSCEDQQQADIRIPLLLQIPAAVRFLSCEPLIGPIDLANYLPIMEPENGNQLHWVIAGGESGKLARPMHPEWVRSLRDQCEAANVPFFFKQWGEYAPLSECSMHDVRKLKRAIVSDPYEHMVFRIGKSKSGNLLDGKQHLNFPANILTTKD
jgi:protein gp37